MATYLLTWNPKVWQWTTIRDDVAEITKNGFVKFTWSSGVTKRIQPDDRVFLIKLGPIEPRGIVASGWAVSKVYRDKRFGSKSFPKTANYVDVHFDTILNPENDKIFPIKSLSSGIYQQKKTWTPQGSGTSIPDEVSEQLEKDWASFLKRPFPFREISYADEIDTQKTYQEGAPKKVITTVYERNPVARAICIKVYGAVCSVCGFDFAQKYGELGNGFIHVHHLQPRAEVGKNSKLNPVRDLRPVCPNCHAMIHQRKPVYSIEELKEIIKDGAK